MAALTQPKTDISDFKLFEGLDESLIEKINRHMEYHFIPKYNMIFQTDSFCDRVYFLLEGVVKLGKHSDDGREVIKSIKHPFAVFGEMGLINQKLRREYAQSLKYDCHLISIKTGILKNLMNEHHKLSLNIMNHFGQKLVHSERRISSLILKDARARIIEFLHESANSQGMKVGFEMLLKHCLTHQDIANITGTSRQTVTSVLNDLKKSNLITFRRGRILIRNLSGLV